MRYAIPFSELSAESKDFAGGKGAMLGELTRIAAQLPVAVEIPQGYVVPSEVFEEWLAKGGVKDSNVTAALRKVGKDIPQLTRIAGMLTERMIRVALPKEVENPSNGFYAVRSSAIGEDGGNMSFAGQHDSYLNCPADAVKARIHNVWLSTFNVRALYYRIVNGIEETPLRQAVVVQKMITPKFAGTAFSIDPRTGIRDQGLIQHIRGLGDRLVSGSATPTSTVFKHAELELLKDEMILNTAQACMELHRLLGYPVDIEWAWDGALKLLQVRPITSLPDAIDQKKLNTIHPVYGDPFIIGESFAPGEITARGFVRRFQAEAIVAGKVPTRKLDNRILVVPYTTPDDLPIMEKVKGVVVTRGGATSHAAIVCRELGKPCIKINKIAALGLPIAQIVDRPTVMDGTRGSLYHAESIYQSVG